MELISHPFRLTGTGQVATVPDGSLDAYAEALAVLVSTGLGERELLPEFGITDPAYDTVSVAQVNAQLDRYGPAIRVVDVETTYPDDTTARTVLTFEEL